MDAKITKNRIGGMLSYDWYKIILIIVGLILAWMFVFNATATKISCTQQFTVINYKGNNSLAETRFSTFYEITDKNAFSYEVIETNTIDAAEGFDDETIAARIRTDEGDVAFLANVNDVSTAYLEEDGETISYDRTYAESFLLRNFAYTCDLDENNENSFFNSLETFLNQYYFETFESGVMDEEKVENDFRARAKNDKRYKTESQVKKGIENEKARIESYRRAYVNFLAYKDQWIQFIYSEVIVRHDDETTEVVAEGYRTIGFTFDVKGMERLAELVNYTVIDGETHTKIADDMTMAFLKAKRMKHGFEYEGLLFLDSLVKWCNPNHNLPY